MNNDKQLNYVGYQKFIFWASIGLSLAVVVVFESGLIDPIDLFDTQEQFVVTTIMELLTIAAIPFALRFMKFGFIRKRMEHAQDAEAKVFTCHKLTLCRQTILLDLMFVNTLLYYFSALTVAYGYMAIILFISLGFIYPSKKRFAYECGLPEGEQ